jgi:PIN domain nuclease of toxin-antitoxin system
LNYLVDTHYLIRCLFDPQKIERPVLAALSDEDAVKYVSKISYWEFSLKYSLGKLELTGITPEEFFGEAKKAGFQTFDVSEDDLFSLYRLPPVENHKDPFYRLLAWQCIRNNLTLITADKRVGAYKQFGLKIL